MNLRAAINNKQPLQNERTLLFTVWSERPGNQMQISPGFRQKRTRVALQPQATNTNKEKK